MTLKNIDELKCPKCNNQNDLDILQDDYYRMDTGILTLYECYACNFKFWVDETIIRQFDDETIEPYIEEKQEVLKNE